MGRLRSAESSYWPANKVNMQDVEGRDPQLGSLGMHCTFVRLVSEILGVYGSNGPCMIY